MAIQGNDPHSGSGISGNDPHAIANASHSILSISNPTPPSVQETGDTGTTDLIFPLTFDIQPLADVTVEYSVDIAGNLTPGLTVNVLPAGGQITVAVANDDAVNPDRVVTVTLTSIVSGDTTLGTTVGVGTVAEDDVAPSVVIIANAADVLESGDTGTTSIVFPISFNTPPETDIAIEYSQDIAGVLQTGLTQLIPVNGGNIVVQVQNDDVVTGDRLVTVTLTDVMDGNAVLSAAISGTGNIIEDDAIVPILSIGNPTPDSIIESGDVGDTTLIFPLSFDVNPTTEIAVEYSTNIAGVVTSGNAYIVPIIGGAISVSIPNDDIVTANRSVTVTLTSITNGDAVIGSSVGSGIIVEDDINSLPDMSGGGGGTSSIQSTDFFDDLSRSFLARRAESQARADATRRTPKDINVPPPTNPDINPESFNQPLSSIAELTGFLADQLLQQQQQRAFEEQQLLDQQAQAEALQKQQSDLAVVITLLVN